MSGRVMAFDFGLRHIGVAVGNRALKTSQPEAVLKARDGIPNWDEVAKIIEEWQPEILLVGLPLNMDGSASDMSERAERFSRRLSGRFQRPVELVDERLSSREAKARAALQGHRGDYQRAPIDDEAAAVILSDWLAQQP